MVMQGGVEKYCGRCDDECEHLIPVWERDLIRFVCATCLDRQEKRINLRPTWKRGRTAR